MDRSVLVIAGPTASGKSAAALAVAARIGGTVINADSMQVYRGLEILTAQPDAAAQARVPHRLYGVLDPAERCSAGRWHALAVAEIDRAFAAGRRPVVVGGTGLYLRALMEGLAPVPPVPEHIRVETRARLAALGNAVFHADLVARDPEGAAAIAPGDSQRLVRAAEVLAATGRSLASWQRERPEGAMPDTVFRTVLLNPPRDVLYAAIDARFDRMVADGALEEATALAARGLDPALPAMKALGVPDLIAATRGEVALPAAVAHARQVTRNYAKRQVTWFARQIVSDFQVNEKFSERTMDKIFQEIPHFP